MTKAFTKENVEVRHVKMDAGDIMNSKKTIAIERKRPEDLWNRVLKGEWDRQMQDLQSWALDTGTVPWLLIEGSFEDAAERTRGKMSVVGCRGAIISAAVRYGISVWYCTDLQDLAYTSVGICRKADEGKLCLPKKIPFARRVKDSRVGVVMQTCRISQRQSQSVLRRFKTIAKVFNASEKDLQRCDYIGPATAKKIHKILHTVYK